MAQADEPPTGGGAATVAVADGFSLDHEQTTIGEALKRTVLRRGTDLGAAPALLGLVSLTILFGLTADKFLSKGNFANLLTQSTSLILLAIGVTFVLLLGEIDLSAGYTAGLCVVTTAYLLAPPHNVSAWIAIPAGFAVGITIGVIIGLLVAKVGIPSFIVTLAFFLTWQGIVLQIAKEGGTIPITNDLIISFVNKPIRPLFGWILFVAIVGGYGGAALFQARRRARAGLPSEQVGLIAIKVAGLAAIWGSATWLLNQNRAFASAKVELRGVPVAVPVVVAVVVVLGFMLDRTGWGRHVYAVGGNLEAARRAGISVLWIKMSCFIMCGVVACLAGLALGSQLNSVSPQTGGNDTLLRAVGAAVIGGVSLFGGRGKIVYPVIGGLVVAMIDNGLGLVGKVGPIDFTESGPRFIVQGLVLLFAASIDALSRKRGGA
jgi:D-xylose transport system permease protein